MKSEKLELRQAYEQRLSRLELLRDGFSRDMLVVRRLLDDLMTEDALEHFDVEKQYSEAINTLQALDFPVEQIPSLERVAAAAEPAMSLIQALHYPCLLFVPDVKFAGMLRRLQRANDARRFGIQTLYFNDHVYGVPTKEITEPLADRSFVEDTPRSYEAWIVEATRQVPLRKDENNGLRLPQRLSAERLRRPAGMQGLQRHQYALLAAHSMRQGRPIDQRTWTVLDEDIAMDRPMVPAAGCKGGPCFASVGAQDVHYTARFRAAVPLVL